MAQLSKMIPFILKWEEGLTDKQCKLPPQNAYAIAAKGGYKVTKGDKGGPTLCGVTLATYAAYRKKIGYKTTTAADLNNMVYDEWYAIYKEMFWDRWQADKIENQNIANILVDWVWLSGSYGIKYPQRYLKVSVDGIVGPKTLAAINAREPKALFAEIKKWRMAYINEKAVGSNARFKQGWINRLNDLKYE